MPSVLTVDDSKAIRTIVSKQMTSLGFEVQEAEDGEQGLQMLEACTFDIVLLDVTMPVLDGPGMLKRMREQGNHTPVIMLTSESKTSVIGETMKLGIEDYILKPFKPEEIRDKVFKVLRINSAANAGPVVTSAAAIDPGAATPVAQTQAVDHSGVKQFIDILCVDDMENVHKKLRALLPDHITMNSATGAQNAVQLCRERIYRCVLVDTTLADVNSVALMNQLRVLQPHAEFLSLALRTEENAEKDALTHGFSGALLKPFNSDALADFLGQYFESQDLVACDGDIAHLRAYTGRAEKVDRYFAKVRDTMANVLENVAAACYEHVILDMTDAPSKADKIVNLLIHVNKGAEKLGLGVVIIGNDEVKQVLGSIAETSHLPFFASVPEARAQL